MAVTEVGVPSFSRGLVLAIAVGSVAILAAGRANADDTQDARAYTDKATAAFALTHYGVAAENFEKAFELKPDPALLYNAAQSYRLAGNKQRALERYQSYLRMYGSEKREEIEKHIEDLKKAIEQDKAVATSPPTGTDAPKGDITKAPPPRTEGNAPVLVSLATTAAGATIRYTLDGTAPTMQSQCCAAVGHSARASIVPVRRRWFALPHSSSHLRFAAFSTLLPWSRRTQRSPS